MPRVDPVEAITFAVPKPPHGETNDDESVRTNPAPTTSTEAPAAVGSETAEGITAASATGGAATTSAATSLFPPGFGSPRKKSRRLNETPTTCERPGVSDGGAQVISPEDDTVAATGATVPKAHAASPVSLNPEPETRTGAPPASPPDENVNDGSADATVARVRYLSLIHI